MAKVLKYDNSIDHLLDEANKLYDDNQYLGAMSKLFAVLKKDSVNTSAKMLIAQIYQEIGQPDLSNEMYFSILFDNENTDAVKGIISNLMIQGHFKEAKYFNDAYNIDYDFSDFLTVETEYGDEVYDEEMDEAELKRSCMHLVVSKDTKDGKNKLTDKPLNEMVVEDFQGPIGDEIFNFKDLMHQLLASENIDIIEDEDDNFNESKDGFKQVYPITKDDCEDILAKATTLNMSGKPELAIKHLNKITIKNGKYYYLAQKSKMASYLSLNRFASMRVACEEALKGFPNDFGLICNYYIALKLTEENILADKLFDTQIKDTKPESLADNFVKLDACRLQMYHQGIIDCVNNIISDVPYQPTLLVLRAKAEYNQGKIKEAREHLINVIKIYPDNFDARFLIEKIDTKADGLMAYGDIDIAIQRVKLNSKINLLLLKKDDFKNYLLSDDNALKDIEFVLSNENEKNVYMLCNNLRNFVNGDISKIYQKILLKIHVSTGVKMVILAFYLYGACPKKIAVVEGRKLKILDNLSYEWERDLSDAVILAGNTVFANFVINYNNYKQLIKLLNNRLQKLSNFVRISQNQQLASYFMTTNDSRAVNRALTNIILNRDLNIKPMSLPDEEYLKVLKYLKMVEEENEI